MAYAVFTGDVNPSHARGQQIRDTALHRKTPALSAKRHAQKEREREKEVGRSLIQKPRTAVKGPTLRDK